MNEHPFIIFLKGIVKKTANTFSIISLIVFVITFFFDIPSNVKLPLQISVVIIAFLFSAYYLWKDTYQIQTKKNELIFNLRETKIVNSIWQGVTLKEVYIYFDFNIQNRGTEKLIVKKIIRIDQNVSDNLIIDKDSNSIHEIKSNIKNRMEMIYLPFDIPGRDHKTIRIKYACKLRDDSSKTIVSFFNNDLPYSVRFEFKYIDLDNSETVTEINITESYKDFKENFIERAKRFNVEEILNMINTQ